MVTRSPDDQGCDIESAPVPDARQLTCPTSDMPCDALAPCHAMPGDDMCHACPGNVSTG